MIKRSTIHITNHTSGAGFRGKNTQEI